MPVFNVKDVQTEYQSLSGKKMEYLENLQKVVVDSKDYLEGNSFYVHRTLNIYPELHNKQLNLFWCGKQGVTRMCEIGFNAGHSTMLMLLGRDSKPIEFTVFDIGEHPYTRPCLQYIKSKFQNVNFEYVEGDSTVTMPKWIEKHPQYVGSYDVVHVDGGHSEHCISNDLKNANALVKVNGIVIVDDTNMPHINTYVDAYVSTGLYKELEVIQTTGYPHRILQKIK